MVEAQRGKGHLTEPGLMVARRSEFALILMWESPKSACQLHSGGPISRDLYLQRLCGTSRTVGTACSPDHPLGTAAWPQEAPQV